MKNLEKMLGCNSQDPLGLMMGDKEKNVWNDKIEKQYGIVKGAPN